ncbi:alpha/beta fold hydrolase [Acinetobacter sp. MD2(2019)]|uniref:alpha/beta fold hydrolase n=1 Tax=Acinetobacter sp. MD2(2019) TaxID=2605273 RepID=UPI002D1F241C|nr:alpha/beta fold hydrolase [Acinetobacter sp. MD2(2019)]MEB3753947.1 alpha/beta fold hydrolase [Acinetobacter sp. MD2(2019)]
MSKRILLITGWGVGIAPLQALQTALQQQGHCVELMDIFDAQQPDALQKAVQQAQLADILIGWSLGGQLALLLAHTLWQRFQQAKPVICLASNPCFVANVTWPHAMPENEFHRFKQQFLNNPAATLKQFYLNICTGQPALKQNWSFLLTHANPPQKIELIQGLLQLQSLHLCDILRTYPAPIHFVFAEQDTLVPSKVQQNILQIATKNVSVQLLENAGHSFPVFDIQQTLQAIDTFL